MIGQLADEIALNIVNYSSLVEDLDNAAAPIQSLMLLAT